MLFSLVITLKVANYLYQHTDEDKGRDGKIQQFFVPSVTIWRHSHREKGNEMRIISLFMRKSIIKGLRLNSIKKYSHFSDGD
jgi:hypothetical protein